GDAGNGRADTAQGNARPQSQPEDHLCLRLRRGCLREEPARKRAVRVPAKAFHAGAACRGREGDHGAAIKPPYIHVALRSPKRPRPTAAAAPPVNSFTSGSLRPSYGRVPLPGT